MRVESLTTARVIEIIQVEAIAAADLVLPSLDGRRLCPVVELDPVP